MSARVPGLIYEVAGGDGSTLAEVIPQLVPPPGFVGMGLQWGVFCREELSQTSADEVLASGKAALPEFPESVLRMPPQIPRVFEDCAIWMSALPTRRSTNPSPAMFPYSCSGGPSMRSLALPGKRS